jgi:LCP family protein required for cell wall assembly
VTDTAAKSSRRRLRRVLIVVTGLLLALLVAAGIAGWGLYSRLNSNIRPDDTTAAELARHAKERPRKLVPNTRDILLIGSDSRAGAGNGAYGRDSGTARSDTTMLLHLAADRRNATVVSVPRDLMVSVPACRRPDGGESEPSFTQLNTAFETGGAACTIRTVEKLSGIRIDHHVIVDFQGFKKMVDALGGVQVCLAEPIHDKAARVDLPAGKVELDGEQALGYVRVRESVGGGSDTERMSRQQRFLGALAAKVSGTGVLLNPVRLYPVLDAATRSLTTDPGLAGIRSLYTLSQDLRDVPPGHVRFLTLPREPWSGDANRDQLAQPAAGKLFALLRKDRPVHVSPGKTGQSGARASGAVSSFAGTTASDNQCE